MAKITAVIIYSIIEANSLTQVLTNRCSLATFISMSAKTTTKPANFSIQKGIPTSDGAGVKLRRYIGTRDQSMFDPFLLLDIFANDDPDAYIAGFPSHPHRGFQTVTYLIEGKMRHRDSKGHEGVLQSGGVQWMTAGKGIIHSEMPEQEDGMLFGSQLWVNLPSHLKMMEPSYQDLAAEDFPVVKDQGSSVKLIAGNYNGVNGPANTHIPIFYFDVRLTSDHDFQYQAPADYNVFLILFSGQLDIESSKAVAGDIVFFTGTDIKVKASADSHFLAIGGQPIGEPVARGGPFVMNTQEEVWKAYYDYEAGRIG